MLGADVAGESTLTYTWATTGTPPAVVSFSINGSNAAKNTTATFSKAGNYTFQVTITDPNGLTATSSVNVTVNQTLTAIAVGPRLGQSARRRHAAVHGHGRGPVRRGSGHTTDVSLGRPRPGRSAPAGLLTAPDTPVASGTVTASSGGVNGAATFSRSTFSRPPWPRRPAASPNPVTGTTCNLSVLGADDAGESNLTYTWSATGTPPAAVKFQRQRQQRGEGHHGHLQQGGQLHLPSHDHRPRPG